MYHAILLTSRPSIGTGMVLRHKIFYIATSAYSESTVQYASAAPRLEHTRSTGGRQCCIQLYM